MKNIRNVVIIASVGICDIVIAAYAMTILLCRAFGAPVPLGPLPIEACFLLPSLLMIGLGAAVGGIKLVDLVISHFPSTNPKGLVYALNRVIVMIIALTILFLFVIPVAFLGWNGFLQSGAVTILYPLVLAEAFGLIIARIFHYHTMTNL